jgi:ABC-2 type transport system ATP-binding protein
VIRHGRLLAVGSPAELRLGAGRPVVEIAVRGIDARTLEQLRAHPLVAGATLDGDRLRIDLRGSGNAAVAPLVRLLVMAGVEVEEVRKGAASLEEAFLELMEEAA